MTLGIANLRFHPSPPAPASSHKTDESLVLITCLHRNSAEVIKVEHPTRGDDTRAWGPPYANYLPDSGKEGPGESAYYLAVRLICPSLDPQAKSGRSTGTKSLSASPSSIQVELTSYTSSPQPAISSLRITFQARSKNMAWITNQYKKSTQSSYMHL